MAVRSPFSLLSLETVFFFFSDGACQCFLTHQIKVGYKEPFTFSQGLGKLVFGATPPSSHRQRSNLTNC